MLGLEQVPGFLRAQAEAELKSRARTAAKGAITSAAQKLGVPSIPGGIPVPKSLTAKGIAEAGYLAAKGKAEQLIQQETGIPIKLPPRLTAKEISRTVGAVIPTDVEEAVDVALTLAATQAASALSSLIVGAAAGSVVPGLGTVVGIGTALAIHALKNLIRESPAFKVLVGVAKFTPVGLSFMAAKEILKPFSKLFAAEKPAAMKKCATQWACPQIPPNLDAFQLIAWANQQLDSAPALALRKEMGGRRQIVGNRTAIVGTTCGIGVAVDCRRFLRTVRSEALGFVVGTPSKMGLYEVESALSVFAVPHDIDPLYGDWRQYGEAPQIVRELQARRLELGAFLREGASGQLSRFRVVTEFTNAVRAYELSQNPNTTRWLIEVSKLLGQVEAREKQRVDVMRATQERRAAYGARQAAADPMAARRKTLEAGCRIGHGPSCEELRRLGGPPPSPPAPVRAPATIAPPTGSRAACEALYADWVRKNPAQARCLTQSDRAKAIDLCFQAHVTKTISQAAALQQIQLLVTNACARAASRIVGKHGLFRREPSMIP